MKPRPRAWRHPLTWLAAGAVALRLVLFLGRGDYVAFDEGWYLLLGRSLLAGDGYTLSGLRHVALSPLFPLLAGGVDVVLRDLVWSGRLVAAVAGGLLVVPCWSIFHHLSGRRTTWIACALVAAMPALAPFVVPYWIGWDLWVGAEPLLHLLLYSGIALAFAARKRFSGWTWLAAGGLFGLAYLARPEAVIVLGLWGLMLGALALRSRDVRAFAYAAVLGMGFALAATPYWLYLHETLGRWTLTGRAIELAPTGNVPDASVGAGTSAAVAIEAMLWSGDRAEYIRRLYALDASGTRLGNTYWGVQDPATAAPPAAGAIAPAPAMQTPLPASEAVSAAPPHSRVLLYFRSLGLVVPWFIWPFILIGVPVAVRALREELLFVLPLLGASIMIAHVVAADPRTQAFVVPLFAFYAARGARRAGAYLTRRLPAATVRRGFATHVIVATMLVLLLGASARRLVMSLAVGSPHHIVGAENRRIGDALRQVVPESAAVMSWHPAIALFARRDWRVLPSADLAGVARYANAIGCEYIVLSAYYPSPVPVEEVRGRHLVLHAPPAPPGTLHWQLRAVGSTDGYTAARLEAVAP